MDTLPLARPTIWVLILLLVLSVGFLLSLPVGTFWITDCSAKYLTAVNLERKGFDDFSIDYPGAALDPEREFIPIPRPFSEVREGQIYSYYPPLFPFLSAPFHFLFGPYGLFVLPLAGALAGAWLTVAIARAAGLGGRLSLLCGAAFYGCTPSLFYTFCFWEHTAANALLLGAVYLLIRSRQGGAPRPALLAGALLGLSVGLREEFYLFAAAVAASLLLERPSRGRPLAAYLAGLALGLLPVWIFQYWAVGSALGFHISNNLASSGVFQGRSLEAILDERLQVTAGLLANVSPDRTLTAVFVAVFVGLAAAALVQRGPSCRAMALLTAGALILAVVTGLIFCLAKDTEPAWFSGDGLLTHGALLLPGLAGFLGLRRESSGEAARLLRRSALLFTVLLCATAPPLTITGLHWGPRLLLPVVPLLLVLSFRAFSAARAGGEGDKEGEDPGSGRRPWKTVLTACFLLLLGVSLATQLFSLSVLKKKLELSAAVTDRLLAEEEDVVVTNIFWLPQDAAGAFYRKRFFLAESPEAYPRLLAALRAAGVESFLYVSWDSGREEPLWKAESDLNLLYRNVAVFRRRVPAPR